MAKLKVAEVITRLDWSGSPEIVRIISSYLQNDEFEMTVIVGLTRYPSAKTKNFLFEFADKIIVLPCLRRDISPFEDLRAFLSLCSIFKKKKFDIVHTHTAKAGALGRLAAFFSGVPVIIHTPHGHNFYGYFGRALTACIVFIERLLSLCTTKFIALTELERSDYVKFKIAQGSKIALVYQGLELDCYIPTRERTLKLKEELGIGEDKKIIGMVGRLEFVKGPCYFVKAASRVLEKIDDRTVFIMVGEGSLRNELKAQVERLGIRSSFIFTGWREDNLELISILDMLVLPSLNEAVGMVLIEAQALGVPVIATRVGGVPEVLKEGITGLLVEPAKADELASAIMELLEDEARRLTMGQAGKEWVAGRFKASNMVEAISQLYKNEFAEKKKSGG
ncbi:MAG: glycosyltransferase family 1 protein [Candidatus Omnitrophota bacterium]|nr:MAG: glycosyltransferase family 1 protein [Candidatus Omnitrophota bacterium]